MNVKYPIILKKSEEGFAVGCPALPGCWSQGASEEEAIGNIKVAIKEYLEVVRESFGEEELREMKKYHLGLRVLNVCVAILMGVAAIIALNCVIVTR